MRRNLLVEIAFGTVSCRMLKRVVFWLGFLSAFGTARLSILADPATSPAQPQKSGRLIIVAPESLQTSLKEFVEYKNTRLGTTFVPLESILQATPGVDDPEKLKRFLYNQWKTNGLGYALLVGDVDIMPAWPKRMARSKTGMPGRMISTPAILAKCEVKKTSRIRLISIRWTIGRR
jgi:hypothetical protein